MWRWIAAIPTRTSRWTIPATSASSSSTAFRRRRFTGAASLRARTICDAQTGLASAARRVPRRAPVRFVPVRALGLLPVRLRRRSGHDGRRPGCGLPRDVLLAGAVTQARVGSGERGGRVRQTRYAGGTRAFRAAWRRSAGSQAPKLLAGSGGSEWARDRSDVVGGPVASAAWICDSCLARLRTDG